MVPSGGRIDLGQAATRSKATSLLSYPRCLRVPGVGNDVPRM